MNYKIYTLEHQFLGEVEVVPDNFTGIVEWPEGTKEWWVNGKRHRLDGPAIEYANGSKLWYLNDKRHRIDGPACEWYNGNKEYFVSGKYHRLDGPAIEHTDGTQCYCINDELISKEQHKLLVNTMKLKGLM